MLSSTESGLGKEQGGHGIADSQSVSGSSSATYELISLLVYLPSPPSTPGSALPLSALLGISVYQSSYWPSVLVAVSV